MPLVSGLEEEGRSRRRYDPDIAPEAIRFGTVGSSGDLARQAAILPSDPPERMTE